MNLKPRVVIGYSRPDNPAWANIIAHANQIHAAVIIGPDSGRWHMFDPDYVALIKRLRGAGIKVFAYVFSKYGARPMADVKWDVVRWDEWYGPMDGFFVDECSTDADKFPYYEELCAWFKVTQGVFLNFGRVPDQKYTKLRASLCISERSQADVLAETYPPWVASLPPEQLLVIVYAVKPEDATRVAIKIVASGVGFYCLSTTGANGEDADYGVEMELFPPLGEDPNWASLTLQQVARTLQASTGATMKDLPALAQNRMTELAQLRAQATTRLSAVPNDQLIEELRRRLQ